MTTAFEMTLTDYARKIAHLDIDHLAHTTRSSNTYSALYVLDGDTIRVFQYAKPTTPTQAVGYQIYEAASFPVVDNDPERWRHGGDFQDDIRRELT